MGIGTIDSKYNEEEIVGEYFAYRRKKPANACRYGRQVSPLPICSMEDQSASPRCDGKVRFGELSMHK